MNKRLIRITLTFTAIASIGIAGVLFASPQHQEHHPEQGMRESAETQVGDSEMLPMCHRMMRHMMTNMHEDMEMMQQMMMHMHAEGEAAEHMGSGETSSLGMMQGMMHGMMGSMMQGLMAVPDTSSVDDPAVAEEQAQSLEAQARLMRDYLEVLDGHIEAFRKRAEELRKQF